MLILGIHGPSRSGKDTIYRMLLEEFPLIKFERQGFADALKISAAKALGIEGDNSELIAKVDRIKESGQVVNPFGSVSGREFLQRYGTEAHREMFGSDFWLDQVIPNVHNPRERYMGFNRVCDVLVIPDVRYQNEIGRVNDAGGQLWKINRSVKGHVTGHASEGELVARWDRVIDNNGTKDDLRSDVKNAFNKIANQIINDRVTKVFQ
jgi:hypothetical protein